MSTRNPKLLTCITCPPASAPDSPYYHRPYTVPAEPNVSFVQCGQCILAEKPMPAAVRQHRAEQLELQEASAS